MAQNNLHGILADDMRLGKTLQTLAEKERIKQCLVLRFVHQLSFLTCSKKPSDISPASLHRLSTSRSAYEQNALHNGHGIPISEQGPTLILTTYSILRADPVLGKRQPRLCGVGQAQLIRNPTTASRIYGLCLNFYSRVLGRLCSLSSRVYASYNQIQGTKCDDETVGGGSHCNRALPSESLAFYLRRTKDQVLKELPPKIIPNILLPLSSLQRRLYVLASSRESIRTSTAAKRGDEHGETKPLTNVLTNLQLLRKICNHPALAVDDTICRCSGKLTGLRDLLVECCDVAAWARGAFRGAASYTYYFDDTNFSPHRCLVFAHLQQPIDLTEQMLKYALPGVTYRRLDGQTPPSKRTDIVQHYNADPSIDVLLLTTAVGGLGLTLTGADTVIFIDHSWNPFVDLQAMDRAHRIGKKRTVRVFRLIMEETLEEHILNIQEYKEQLASTVVQKIDASTGMSSNKKDILN
ncbi:hypothetical protein PsorP6_000060 [Peronosclerospora sorghi]|uniref:Uncharacterized protein n=1 Tax=Peronosclerospora sorghi TaxID=230839 RepID=A0ACC0WQK7_9STRA|nr:hypothetical protein PsorP6_000060 [Peronosclerospora sorghi]